MQTVSFVPLRSSFVKNIYKNIKQKYPTSENSHSDIPCHLLKPGQTPGFRAYLPGFHLKCQARPPAFR